LTVEEMAEWRATDLIRLLKSCGIAPPGHHVGENGGF
jgi:hypothetical protein